MEQLNLYIPSLEAKDIIAAQSYKNCTDEENAVGYSLCNDKGEYNLKKFKNSFDYSLDLIELKEYVDAIYGGEDVLSFKANNRKIYSDKIINVTFKFSYKEFNKISRTTFVKNGYKYDKLHFNDSLAWEDGELVGIITEEPIQNPETALENSMLPKGFSCVRDKHGCLIYICNELEKRKKNSYVDSLVGSSSINTLIDVKALRQQLYKNGFVCNGIKYVRFKRSSGSARVGKCLFIDERLYNQMHISEQCGLDYQEGDEIDLAAIEAYISLTSSSIVDTLVIRPENILVIDDYESVFEEEAVVTEVDEHGSLITTQKMAKIKNSIWDGESLIDISLLGEKYSKKGMLLLRNKFFKSCCFNTNIQKWFKDNGITKISQLNGKTIAKKIEDVKLITTPSSIKYFKFGKFETWLNHIFPYFGIVKYDKNTHFFGGELVQAHYQLINTLQLSEKDVEELVKPGLDYVSLMHSDIDVFKYHLNFKVQNKEIKSNIMQDTNEIVYKMLQFNDDFPKTEIFSSFERELRSYYLKNMKQGHLLINGTYSTLFGNPLEMLQQSIGKYIPDTTSIPVGCVHNTRYAYNTEILGCRSPHVTMGNLFVAKNVAIPEIDEYFNLTPQIICINSINENTLERLSGADFDSDQMIITNNKILIEAAKKNYDIFKVPTSNVHASKAVRYYTKEDMADLDIKTGKNKIGEIINLSQELNSLIWNRIYDLQHDGVKNFFDEIKDIYYDVCQLDVMSCIEIDKAKKEFTVDNTKELKKLREKYQDILMCQDENDGLKKKIKPKFFGYIASTKGYFDSEKNAYIYQNTAMDYLYKKLAKFRVKKSSMTEKVLFSDLFRLDDYDSKKVNYKQLHEIVDQLRETQSYINSLWNIQSGLIYTNYEKMILVMERKEDLCDYINEKDINEHTVYKMISMIDDKSYSDIKRLLMTVLFNYNNEHVLNILQKKPLTRTQLIQDANGEIEIYGIKFTKVEMI